MENESELFAEDMTGEQAAGKYPKDLDEATLARATELEEALYAAYEEYEATEEDFESMLRADHEMLEELADESALLALIEIMRDEDEKEYDTIEAAYLNVIDKLFELSKTYHPLSELGKSRLWAALTFTEEYEKKYRPLLTQVTASNAEKCLHLLTERYYEDVVNGRKNAIAALRYTDETAYPAGIVVYHFTKGAVTEEPILRIDYVYVDEEYRQHGVGNHLFGRMMCFAAQYERCPVTVAYVPPMHPDEKQTEEMTVIMNCLDSWRFDFSMNYGTEFYVRLSDLKGNTYLDRQSLGVRSLKELGEAGKGMLKRFFRARNAPEDRTIAGLPYEYFDSDLSCVAAEDDKIAAVLLIHRYSDGNLRLEYLRGLSDMNVSVLKSLPGYAYHAYTARGEEAGMLTGEILSEEGEALLRKLVPSAQMMLTYEGILLRPSPSEDMTGEQWKRLSEEIGLPAIIRNGNGMSERNFDGMKVTEINQALSGIDHALLRISEAMSADIQ